MCEIDQLNNFIDIASSINSLIVDHICMPLFTTVSYTLMSEELVRSVPEVFCRDYHGYALHNTLFESCRSQDVDIGAISVRRA